MMSYALDELPWPEVGKALAHDPRLLVPVGALEQHGPHLPLGTNTFIATRVAEGVSEATGILTAPPFSYGVTLGGGPWAGSAGLRRKTFHRALNELLARWEDDGVQDFLLVTAHRYEPHVEALLLSLTAHSRTHVYDLWQTDMSDLLTGDPELEHAGELETSVMLYLAPERVRTHASADFVADSRQLRRYTRGRVPTPPPESRGTVGRPTLASAEKGEAVFRRWVGTLSAMFAPRATNHPEDQG